MDDTRPFPQLDFDDRHVDELPPDPSQEEASGRRFANVDIEDKPKTPKPKFIPPPSIIPDVKSFTLPNKDNVERAIRDKFFADKADHVLKDTVRPFGTAVIATGVENANKSRQSWKEMDLAVPHIEKGIAMIEAEKRIDATVDATTLHFDSEGKLTRGGGKALPLTPHAFERLTSVLEIPGANYLSKAVPQNVCIDLMNGVHFPGAKVVDGREWRSLEAAWEKDCRKASRLHRPEPPKPLPPLKNREILIRTRAQSPKLNTPHIFAVCGAGYQPFDLDKVLQKVAPHLPAGARASSKYDGQKAVLDVVFHSNVEGINYVAGEIFKVAMRINLADDGTGGIKISTVIWRNLCLNLIIIDENIKARTRRKHVGMEEDIGAAVELGVRSAFEALGPFTAQWNEATVENIIDKYGMGSIGEVVTAIVHNHLADVPGGSSEEKINRIIKSWEKEPGLTKTAVINAISRAAHEYEWSSPWTTEALEEQAGQLLYQKNWNVFLTPEQQEYAKELGV